MSFEEALAEYGRLRQAYNSGQMNAQDFGQRVQQIQVRDGSGNYWAIDGATGGWLRYDGSSWVPGQPPIPQQPAGMAPTQLGTPQMGGGYDQQPASGGFGQQGGFGNQPQGGFGSPQQQGGFGAPAQGGFGAAPQQQYGVPQQPMTPVQPAQPARGGRRLLIGCLAAVGVFLVFCVAGAVLLQVSGNSFLNALSGTSGITEAATARTVTSDKKPDEKATEFKQGEELYITYKASSVKAGQYIDLKMFRNGTAVTLQDTQTPFEKDATYYGYYSYTPNQLGDYRVELYFNGEATPSQTVNFSVK